MKFLNRKHRTETDLLRIRSRSRTSWRDPCEERRIVLREGERPGAPISCWCYDKYAESNFDAHHLLSSIAPANPAHPSWEESLSGVLLSLDPVLSHVNKASQSFDVSSNSLGNYVLILTGTSNGKVSFDQVLGPSTRLRVSSQPEPIRGCPALKCKYDSDHCKSQRLLGQSSSGR